MSTDDKIVQFPTADGLPENPIQIVQKPGWCQHQNINLDTHDRIVICVKCGATLDAFGFLYSNARLLQTAWQNHRLVNSKIAELNNRVQVLAKEEKRLRSQVKRLQEKTGSISVRGDEL